MTSESDQSTSIVLERDDWKFHDNYVGGEPYGGREVVFYKGKPVWLMAYYGAVEELVEELKTLYQFLRQALAHIPAEAPYRGPKEFRDGQMVYHNIWHGTVEQFSGEEWIESEGQKVYRAMYFGGLVNLR